MCYNSSVLSEIYFLHPFLIEYLFSSASVHVGLVRHLDSWTCGSFLVGEKAAHVFLHNDDANDNVNDLMMMTMMVMTMMMMTMMMMR